MDKILGDWDGETTLPVSKFFEVLSSVDRIPIFADDLGNSRLICMLFADQLKGTLRAWVA